MTVNVVVKWLKRLRWLESVENYRLTQWNWPLAACDENSKSDSIIECTSYVVLPKSYCYRTRVFFNWNNNLKCRERWLCINPISRCRFKRTFFISWSSANFGKTVYSVSLKMHWPFVRHVNFYTTTCDTDMWHFVENSFKAIIPTVKDLFRTSLMKNVYNGRHFGMQKQIWKSTESLNCGM